MRCRFGSPPYNVTFEPLENRLDQGDYKQPQAFHPRWVVLWNIRRFDDQSGKIDTIPISSGAKCTVPAPVPPSAEIISKFVLATPDPLVFFGACSNPFISLKYTIGYPGSWAIHWFAVDITLALILLVVVVMSFNHLILTTTDYHTKGPDTPGLAI